MPNVVDAIVLDPLIATNGWTYTYEDDVDVTRTRNKSESRNAPIPYLVKRFKIPFQVLSKSQRLYLLTFVKGRVNRLRGFLMWDFENYQATDSPIGTGDGATKTFQLSFTEGDSYFNYQKPATRPVPTGTTLPYQVAGVSGATATITVKVNGTAKVQGTDYAVNPANGIVTFTTAPASGAAILASFLYYTPVRFDGPGIDFNVDGVIGSVQGEMIELLERQSS